MLLAQMCPKSGKYKIFILHYFHVYIGSECIQIRFKSVQISLCGWKKIFNKF